MGAVDDLEILAVQEVEVARGLRHLELFTMRGLLTLLWHGPADARAVVLAAGGAMGGLLGPAGGLYHQLGAALAGDGLGLICIGYRKPNDLSRCVHDMAATAEIAYSRGADAFVTMGHSFGGAVALNAAVILAEHTKGVVTFSTQSAGCEIADQVPESMPLLLFHGDRDELLPVACSETVRMLAGHGELVVLPGAGHILAGMESAITDRLVPWLAAAFAEVSREGTREGPEGPTPV